jgi:hypothetical protein
MVVFSFAEDYIDTKATIVLIILKKSMIVRMNWHDVQKSGTKYLL